MTAIDAPAPRLARTRVACLRPTNTSTVLRSDATRGAYPRVSAGARSADADPTIETTPLWRNVTTSGVRSSLHGASADKPRHDTRAAQRRAPSAGQLTTSRLPRARRHRLLHLLEALRDRRVHR